MMNEVTIEAIANANAQLNNVDVPNFSEALEALRSAADDLQTLVKLNRLPANCKGLRDAMNVLNRVPK